VSVFSAARTCSGKLFHALAATLKARSPNFRRVLGTNRKSDLVAERKTVERDESVSTGCRISLMNVGTLPTRVRWSSRHSLNCMRASTGSHSSIMAAETWLRERKPYTSLTERWQRAVLVQWSCTAVRRADICCSQSVTTPMRRPGCRWHHDPAGVELVSDVTSGRSMSVLFWRCVLACLAEFTV